MNWRIYRLPGSREVWHVDSGPQTPVYNVTGFDLRTSGASSVDVGGANVPRAWIQTDDFTEMHIVNGKAIFDMPNVIASVREALETTGIDVDSA